MSNNPYSHESDQHVNPFAASESDAGGPGQKRGLPPGQRRGFVRHVPAVGVLMIIQGVAEFLFGVLFIGIAIFGPQFIADAAADNPAVQNADFTAEQIKWITIGVYGTIGVGTLTVSLLSIVAGFQATRYRGHLLSLVSLCSGFFTLILGCYCFPTALALGIYGLIVMLDGPVKTAFNLRKSGWSAKQIKERFGALNG